MKHATILLFGLFLLLYHAAALAAPIVWRDHATGFAIAGYDPLAYHTRKDARLGTEGIEYRWGGAVWQFLNTGNRDAFARHPEVYAPRFAGYDVLALSRGFTVQGKPTVWTVYEGALYLFEKPDNLRDWRLNPDEIIKQAQLNWQKLGADLPGTSER